MLHKFAALALLANTVLAALRDISPSGVVGLPSMVPSAVRFTIAVIREAAKTMLAICDELTSELEAQSPASPAPSEAPLQSPAAPPPA